MGDSGSGVGKSCTGTFAVGRFVKTILARPSTKEGRKGKERKERKGRVGSFRP